MRARHNTDFIYRDIGTPDELIFYAKRWRQRQYAKYRVGFFAFHGRPDFLIIGRRDLRLDELGELLKGCCRGKIVYFGGCGTLATARRYID
jgi:hypothetical protein